MRDDEHHLQTIRYKRDETHSECEGEKDDKLMEGFIREWTLKTTHEEESGINNRTHVMKLLKS